MSSDYCEVYYFLCPKCKKTAAMPDFKSALTCQYCNCEMKAIITQD